jgi:hypothetical protein
MPVRTKARPEGRSQARWQSVRSSRILSDGWRGPRRERMLASMCSWRQKSGDRLLRCPRDAKIAAALADLSGDAIRAIFERDPQTVTRR